MSDDFGKATHADAELVLKLYDLRREPVMRDARKFFGGFNPQSADEIIALIQAQTPENAYFRQVTSFWEMAATLVHHGALNEGLFLDTQGELFFVYAKIAPYLAEVREKLDNPHLMAQSEKLINHTELAQQKLAAFTERLKKMAARRAQAAKQ
ncbi:hypothetical protein Acid345_3339 [Candidatus Koribacter versatilis Ellin345]|uniref:Uncharacterized protein n=1 Tax=Koribacter versatilis (strain Ellin345) TaxID=204669 RepID=Q1ILB0_KORVE|nr:hypothetical protein [Candidatus Koribacter versatilis]ABF42340.1 hypothetical protein Acid345_3339 [Candidatus Koribacter versatilis Ellin345]